MKIKRLRIHNFKSISDSGDIYFNEGVTILAGKNESGKSSILEAIALLNAGEEISQKDLPIQDKEQKTKIEVEYSIDSEEMKEILDEANIDIEEQQREYTYTRFKEYPNKTTYSKANIDSIIKEDDINFQQLIKTSYGQVFSQKNLAFFSQRGVTVPPLTTNYQQMHATISTFPQAVAPHLPLMSQDEQDSLTKYIAELVALTDEAQRLTPQPRARLLTSISNRLPNYILFSSFGDVFPNVVPLPELSTNEWINDLTSISDLDVETIIGDDQRAKATHKKSLNTRLNKDFERFWTQDLSSLEVDWDSTNLYFWINENNIYYEPEIRSQGRRWHLAFYIRVTARAKDEVNNILLIDEPGLYLHATAQRDINKKFDDTGKHTQVIFSTHSPYLIEPDKLDRVRLVLKDESRGTYVENKIHKVSDTDTLTPIISAIGLELTQGILNIDKLNNVIVEGASDYYYLNAFKQIAGAENINFIYGGGSGNMPKVGTILQGWGANVIYLYDNDKGYQDALKNIKKNWATTTKEILTKISAHGSIEDTFTRDDFATYVLRDPDATYTESNSSFVNGKDKVLKAKQFFEMTRKDKKIKLQEETIDNVKKTIESISSTLKKQYQQS